MSWLDPNWRYSNAAETNKPNYLRRKFERIQREIEAKKKADGQKVTPICAQKKARKL